MALLPAKLRRVFLSALLAVVPTVFIAGCGDDPVKPGDPPRIAALENSPLDAISSAWYGSIRSAERRMPQQTDLAKGALAMT